MANRLCFEKQCPYWSENKKNCTVCTGGLFIPLEEHIATYCTTSLYPDCPRYHFERKAQLPRNRVNKKEDRRQHSRYIKRIPVQLILLNAAGNIVYQFTNTADTIDLSAGGMQISSVEPLADDSYISFSFGQEYPPVLQSSIGRVKWCRYTNERYMAGLAFQTEQTAKAVRLCMGLRPN